MQCDTPPTTHDSVLSVIGNQPSHFCGWTPTLLATKQCFWHYSAMFSVIWQQQLYFGGHIIFLACNFAIHLCPVCHSRMCCRTISHQYVLCMMIWKIFKRNTTFSLISACNTVSYSIQNKPYIAPYSMSMPVFFYIKLTWIESRQQSGFNLQEF